MQKLFNRVGTQQHKYRLALHFTNIMVHSLNSHGAYYRIVLQRGSKKYTSNYLTIQPSVENSINQTIQVKATMFYDVAKCQYQQKKFDILILRKDFKEEAVVGRFSLAAENCLRFRGEQSVFKDHMNKLEVRIYCQRIEGSQPFRDTSTSDRGSVNGSIDSKFRFNERNSIKNEYGTQPVIPQTKYPARISTDNRQEDFRKSIVEQFRIEDSRQKQGNMAYGGQQPHFPPMATQHLPQQPQMPHLSNATPLQNSNASARPVSPQLTMPFHQVNPFRMVQQRPTSPPLPPLHNNPNPTHAHISPQHSAQKLPQQHHIPQQPPQISPQHPTIQPLQNPYPQSPTKTPMQTMAQNFRVSITSARETEMQMAAKPPQYPPYQPIEQKVPTFKSLDIDKDKLPVNRRIARSPSPPPVTLPPPAPPLPPRPPTPKSQIQFCSQITAVDSQVFMKPKDQAIVFAPLQDKAYVKESYLSATFKHPADFDFSLSNQLEPKSNNITQLTQNFKLILERERQKHQYQRERHKLELERQRDRFNLDLERERHKFDIEKENHRYELQRHRKADSPRHQVEIDRYRHQLEQFKQEMEIAIKKHREEIQGYRQENLNLKEYNKTQQLKLQQKHKSAQTYYIQQINKIKETANNKQQQIARLTQLFDEKQAIFHQQLSNLRLQLQNIRSSNQQETTNFNNIHQQEVQNLIRLQQQQIHNINKVNQQKHEALINQINRLNDELISKSHQIKHLSEQIALRQNYIQQRQETVDKLNHKIVQMAKDQTLIRQIQQLQQLNSEKVQEIQTLTKINQTIKADLTLLGQEHNSLNAIHQDLKIELSKAISQLNNVKGTIDQRNETILLLNGRIVQLANTVQQQSEQLMSKSPQLLRLNRQYNRLSIENRNSIGQMEQLRSDREAMLARQAQLLNKCQQLEQRYQQKEQQLNSVIHKIRQMEFTMVNPEEDPNYLHSKEELKRLQTVIGELQQIIQAKSTEMDMLNDKLYNTNCLLSQTVRLWTIKENSMMEAMAAKDNRLLELERDEGRASSKSEVTVKYAMVQQDKKELLLKISALNCQIERLREVQDEVAVTEAMNRDLQVKIRQLYTENQGLKSELDLHSYVRDRPVQCDQQDLTNQLTRANSRIAEMLQYVYRQNPSMARQLAQIRPTAHFS